METEHETPSSKITEKQIEDVPDEVLEFILSFLPPYRDLENCMSVSKRWYECSQNVKRKTSKKLLKAITEFKVIWKPISLSRSPSITNRFSHSACIVNNCMYIFGGCTTNTTAFNDLWCFDLSTRKWTRPIATGTYPAPKAYTSMVAFKNILIVFGGYTYPSNSPYFQNVTMFNDLHFYNIEDNKWTLITTCNDGPLPMGGHSACIKGKEMIVFGGLVAEMENHIVCTNDVWVLDLVTLSWRKQVTIGNQPHPRYAQSLIPLDDDRVLMLGGTQPYHTRFIYNDCWVLTTKGDPWIWKEITIKNKEWGAANIWCNKACRVGDKIVSLSRCKFGWNCAKPLITSALRLNTLVNREEAPLEARLQQYMRRPLDRDQNINGKRGVLPRQPANKQANGCGSIEPVAGPSNEESHEEKCANADSPQPGSSGLGAKSKPSSMNKFNNAKIVRQLREANKYRMAAFACDPPADPPVPPCGPPEPVAEEKPVNNQPVVKKAKGNTLTLHVLDISTILDSSLNYVSWLCPRLGEMNGAPEEVLMYSLLKGNGELIMFGGVHNKIDFRDFTTPHSHPYPITMYFLTFPRDII